MLRLFFLGRPQIFLDDRPVSDFISEKALALICYLAVRQGSHSRDSLAGLLWGEMPEGRARANLRMAFYNLQQLLPGCIKVTRLDAAFNREIDCWSDVEQLAAMESVDLTPLNAADVGASDHAWDTLRLYRGEFLEGLYVEDAPAFGEWLLVERERARQAALSVSRHLTDFALSQSDYRLAIQALRRTLDIEPWHETAHRQLMLALARSGDTSGALAQYAACRRVLAEGLGVDPMAETAALAERIRAARQKTRRSNLPARPTPFVGRTVELAGLRQMIHQPHARLITLTGPGGIGKTRLALQAAADLGEVFFEGVYFVPLSSLTGADSLPAAILDALEIPMLGEIDPLDQLRDAFHHQEMLLVLDSFESVLESAGMLGELIQGSAGIRFLVTSRERLNLQWETIYPVEGFKQPAGDDLEASDAARFVLQCIRRLRPDLTPTAEDREAIRRLCQITEGMPLALELASAWVSTQSLAAIAEAVQHDLDMLTSSLRDVAPRHRSLRAAIDRSWEMLPADSQQGFRRLAVFRGGFTPDAAQQIGGASAQTLAGLVLKSMLRQDQSGRYEFHEMLRQFAEEKLEGDPGEWQRMTSLHSQYYGRFLQAREERIRGSDMAGTLREIRKELDNIRSAWRWSLAEGDWDTVSHCLICLSRFYEITSLLHEGENAFSQAVQAMRADLRAETTQTVQLFARLLVEQARFTRALAHHDAALDIVMEAVAALERYPEPGITAAAQLQWAEILERQGDYASAGEHYQRSLALAEQSRSPALKASSLIGLGIIAGEGADVAGASAHFREALQVSQSIGDRHGENTALHNLAIAAIYQNDTAGAQRYFEDEVALVRELGSRRWEVMALLALNMLADHRGDTARLEQYSRQALQICEEIGDRREIGTALDGLGLAALSQGRFGDANQAFAQAQRSHAEAGNRQSEHVSRMYSALVQRALGEFAAAKSQMEEALAVLRELKTYRDECVLLSHLSVTQHLLGEDEAAHQSARQAVVLADKFGDHSFQATALAAGARALQGLGRLEDAITAQQKSLALRVEEGQEHLAVENLADLALLALARGDKTQASEQVEQILRYQSERLIEGLEPFRVFLAAYQTLEALDDPRARLVLRTAVEQLHRQAENIPQPAQRKSFLEKVPVNRALLQAWLTVAE